MGEFYEKVKERLIRYAKVDTESANGAGRWPTTDGQYDLAGKLERELGEIGASDVWLDEENCVVYGTLPSNLDHPAEPLGLIAHMDTAPDASGKDVKPWVLEHYDGGDIVLNEEKGIVMRAADYENLRQYVGQDLILTDGTTLLGGDDKASIASIMTFSEHLAAHPEIPHGEIRLAFTPDEEVGGLAHTLDLARFGAPTAYTLDGDHLGWYMDETFNAAGAAVTIRGLSVHTATAKGIMINAADIAAEYIGFLPPLEKPQYTEGTEGFFFVSSCAASCEHGEIRINIRDFDSAAFAARKAFLNDLADRLNKKYGPGTVTVRIDDQYFNLKEVLKDCPFLVERLKQAISEAGLTPRTAPFRGGTDGSALSFRGLPCPNLSAGYENAHGRFEYVPVQSMEKNVEILLKLAALYAEG